VIEAGANALVAGSAVFGAESYSEGKMTFSDCFWQIAFGISQSILHSKLCDQNNMLSTGVAINLCCVLTSCSPDISFAIQHVDFANRCLKACLSLCLGSYSHSGFAFCSYRWNQGRQEAPSHRIDYFRIVRYGSRFGIAFRKFGGVLSFLDCLCKELKKLLVVDSVILLEVFGHLPTWACWCAC
jgi:hypothetical protein